MLEKGKLMIRLRYLLCVLATTAVFFGLTTPVLAGPATPTPPTATPATATPATATPATATPATATPATATPVTATPATATPATATPATPTPEPSCTDLWPEDTINTIGKGRSPSNNPKVSHAITGRIVDPSSLGDNAHRIPVCTGSMVTAVVLDSTGEATNTAGGSLVCNGEGMN